MSRRNFLPWLFTIIFCLFGLSLLLIVLLPFGTMKTLLNVLSRDGNLSLLRMDNAVVFRFLIGASGLSLLGLAYLTGKHLWEMVIRFIRQMWRDFRKFFSFSNISRSEKGFLVSLSVVTILAGINRLALMESPMLHDEAYTVVTYADSFFHALTDYSMPNNHVFHTLLVNLSVRAFGLAPWSARLPAFLAGVWRSRAFIFWQSKFMILGQVFWPVSWLLFLLLSSVIQLVLAAILWSHCSLWS